jgi:hypothetical protein
VTASEARIAKVAFLMGLGLGSVSDHRENYSAEKNLGHYSTDKQVDGVVIRLDVAQTRGQSLKQCDKAD